ncbi:MAG: hypothetical protein LAO76_27145 [Acidobacteriia bacterium]|nr:hypothetical protein [Terriglobia bacterium]
MKIKQLDSAASISATIQQSVRSGLYGVVTLCRPDSKNEKIWLKLGPIGRLKNKENRFRQPFDRPFELGFGFCFQQSSMGGGVDGWVQTGHIPDRTDRAHI